MNYEKFIDFYNYMINNNISLPEGSNSFYNIDTGIINLYANENNLYDIFTDEGIINSGIGVLNIDNNKFKSFYIIQDTEFILNDALIIDNGNLYVFGVLSLEENSTLSIKNNSTVIFYPNSKLIIKDNVNLNIENSNVSIYGNVNIHLSNISTLIDDENIYIDSATLFEVEGIDITNRIFSLSDYEISLRELNINENTQGEFDNGDFRYQYIWKKSYGNKNKLLELSLDNGEAPLGDFKFSILGIPESLSDNKQMISELNIEEKGILYISDTFKASNYIRPNLYIGIEIGNNLTPGNCNVFGKLILSGKNSFITLDRKGTLNIKENATMIIENNSKLISTNNNDTNVLFINGTLIIDQLEQLIGFNKDNIVFGENGKLIILNKYNERKILFSTPNGIKESYLYSLFENRLDKIQYYINENTGIKIDQYYEYYEREFTECYNGMRFEKAIKEEFIIFNNGFIELDNNIIPWVNLNCNLYDAAKIFKNNSTSDRKYRLQQVVNNLLYAGCGNIIFRFIKDTNYVEYTLNSEPIKLKNIINKPLQSNEYIVSVTNKGQLFLNNNIDEISNESIINENSLKFDLEEENNIIEINE